MYSHICFEFKDKNSNNQYYALPDSTKYMKSIATQCDPSKIRRKLKKCMTDDVYAYLDLDDIVF